MFVENIKHRISKYRFYIKNALWNYKFWFFCKKSYKNISYIEYDTRGIQRKNVSKRRFEGYLYKGKLYLDNPGFPNIEKEAEKILNKRISP